MFHEFRLSPAKRGRGVSCDANGAFIGGVPLLKRALVNGRERWEARECGALSKEIAAEFGLPIDMSSKMGGVRAISRALNEGDLARAQIATVLLAIPEPPVLSKGVHDRADLIAFIDDLHWSGLIKADWDPNEHPRWPAGAPDSQGGEFAPKGDDTTADQTVGEAAEPRPSRDVPRDVGISARRRFYDANTPSSLRPDLGVDDEKLLGTNPDDSKRPANDASDAEDLGIYASYGPLIGDVQVAATATALGGLAIAAAKPANWANVTRLANGALELGSGQIITAAALLTAMDAQRARAAVDAAIGKFGLDPANAAEVLAAHAYVWAKVWAPLNFKDVPWDDPQQFEAASQAIMALELARPGTLYLALHGDKASTNYMDAAAEDGMRIGAIFESRPRPANLPAALQTKIENARAALKLETNEKMQAHHLIPANVWGGYYSDIATLAGEAGWRPDEVSNLIALPANAASQVGLAARGIVLPIHSSSHRIYDLMTRGLLIIEEEKYSAPLTPAQARAVFETVAQENRGMIMAGIWMPRLR